MRTVIAWEFGGLGWLVEGLVIGLGGEWQGLLGNAPYVVLAMASGADYGEQCGDWCDGTGLVGSENELEQCAMVAVAYDEQNNLSNFGSSGDNCQVGSTGESDGVEIYSH